jgi:RNA ligase
MNYDLNAFEDMVKHGYLRKAENDDLVLYGYTDQCTFERAWQTRYTRDARGIIFEKKTGRLVAKPFPKFFNLGEMDEVSLLNLPKEPYKVYEKCDGSLGIIYYYKGRWNVATRGSLGSEQAIRGAEILSRNPRFVAGLNKYTDMTYLVEIIYPENKIIVDYKGEEKLVLLGAYWNKTGVEYPFELLRDFAIGAGMPYAKEYDYTIEQMIELQKTMPKDEEGFVVRFEGGTRVKIKGHEYMRIAKMISQMSPLSFWEAMEDGKVSRFYVQQLPEEFRAEYEPMIDTLEKQYTQVLLEINADAKLLVHIDTTTKEGKKQLGLLVQGKNALHHPSAMFPYLVTGGKALNKYVMNLIRPTGNAFARGGL